MGLAPGARLGTYEIVALIGVGGMGEVYKGRDTRLDRTVAIKVLPPDIASRPSHRERFEREARAISQLTHPHICVLYDIGAANGVNYLVLEYLEGESLAERLTRGPLPIAEALTYAIQMAGALEQAHRSGVIHRDLKPANVMLTRGGAKLLDFGLARLQPAILGRAEEGAVTAPPTADLTAVGTILGTPQYMSPEQVEGREADARSDVWGFGCVLYEMLAGARPFGGNSSAGLIGSILRDTPQALSLVDPRVPTALERVVMQCLAKDPNERWQSAGDLRRELQWIAGGAGSDGRSPVVTTRSQSRSYLRVALIALAGIIAAGVAGYFLAPEPPQLSVQTFAVVPPTGASGLPMGSPDGRMLAYIADDGTSRSIWVRNLEAAEPRRVPGTEGASLPFWSPDSTRLGFLQEGVLKRIGIDGRGLQNIGSGRGTISPPVWTEDDTIVFSLQGQLMRIAASGGTAAPLFAHSPEHFDLFPSTVEGASLVLFSRSPAPFRFETATVHVAFLDGSSPPQKLLEVPAARYAPPGYLVFPQQGKLVAQRFDPQRVALAGSPFTVKEDFSTAEAPIWWASRSGALVIGGIRQAETHLAWFDRGGRQTGTIPMARHCRNPELSPDQQTVALECYQDSPLRDIWLADAVRGTSTRLTSDEADDSDPIWSPDGRYVMFSSNRGSAPGVYRKLAGGARDEELLSSFETRFYTTSWSADGKFVLIQSASPTRDIFTLLLDGAARPQSLVSSAFDEIEAQLSPDGRFFLYSSNESGRSEVYVQPIPTTGDKWPISTGGGSDGRWRGDGQEIFYVSPDRAIHAVPFAASPRVIVGTPTKLFEPPIAGQLGIGQRFPYAVTRDGQRFLVYSVKTPAVPELRVMLNWQTLDPAGAR